MSSPVFWLFALLLVSALGTYWAVRGERRRPSSYSRRPEVLAAWRSMSTGAQAAHDNAVLDAAENAAAERARINALYHP